MSRTEEQAAVQQFLATKGATRLPYIAPVDSLDLCRIFDVGAVAGQWDPPKEDTRAYNFTGRHVGEFQRK